MKPYGFHVENFQIFLARMVFYFSGARKGKRVATKKITSKNQSKTKLFG